MAAIEISLYEALVAHGALTAIVADSIYPDHARQGATLPSVVYCRVSGVRVSSLSGYSGLENPRFQFDVYSESVDDLADIHDAIIGALAAATTFKAVPADSPWDDWDDDVGIYRRTFDVSIWNQE